MDKNTYISSLYEAFKANGLETLLSEQRAEKLYTFSNMLVETNKQFNLTAITDENEIIVKHFVDCASISPLIPHGATLIDVGCGAGFPSVPIAILRDDITVTALDSTQKRINFVESVVNSLGLVNLNAICARAEDHAAEMRESYDVCTSRAVARLNVLSELCIPLIKSGGKFIAMKSVKGDEELAEATNGIKRLGAVLESRQEDKFSWRGIESERKLFTFAKNSPTPAAYPRKYSQITKKPL